MNVILGASGQIGSAIAGHLIKSNGPVRGVIRNTRKADALEKKGVKVSIADYFDPAALQDAVKDGDLIFVLTPETSQSEDVLGDTQTIVENYRKAIETSAIRKIVGLSSMGAQHKSGTGNLLMSYMLEHTFTGIPIPQVFVRPAYYYSNWLLYLPAVKEHGMLPTFYPPDLQIPMVSPMDVAAFIADKIVNGIEGSAIYELEGPEAYSSNDVAHAFGEVVGRTVKAQQIPRESWEETLQEAGFTQDVMKNFIAMTEAVIDGRAKPERKGTNPIKLPTTLHQYFNDHIK